MTILLLLVVPLAGAQPAPPDHQPKEDQLPAMVMKSLNTRFPNAEITKWTREKEGEIEIYDIEFTQSGKSFEADIKADGSIHNWEKAIQVTDLPAAVRSAAAKRYPDADLREVMAITAVAGGKETLEGYEIVLISATGGKEEISVAPDGRILEDSGEQQEEVQGREE
jgi:hypothetical protein